MARTVTLEKTAIFKLHNPGATKRRVLDTAFARYGEAYNLLLEKCSELAQSWLSAARDDPGRKLPTPHRAMKDIYPLCPPCADLGLSGALRDGLISDVAGNLLSYCQLRLDWERAKQREKMQPSSAHSNQPRETPTARGRTKRPAKGSEPAYPAPFYGHRPDAYSETLANVARWVGDPAEFPDLQGRLTREAKQVVRPLSFCRLRDFSLERLDNERWGVTLNLQPRGGEAARLRFPLAFGEWHEHAYLEKGTPKCAHLCRRDGRRGREYFLHVAFEFPVQVIEPSETQALLGIDRGIVKQAAYALTDRDGRVLQTGALGRELRQLQDALGRQRQADQKAGRRVTARAWQRRRQEEILHLIANALVALARQHQAWVVMERLNLRSAGRFVRSQYAKFAKILAYKLTQAGLPQPKEVFAADSSKLCSRCGKEGRRDGGDFACPACGARLDADENAAVNIARRALYKKSEWQGDYRAFHRSFFRAHDGAA